MLYDNYLRACHFFKAFFRESFPIYQSCIKFCKVFQGYTHWTSWNCLFPFHKFIRFSFCYMSITNICIKTGLPNLTCICHSQRFKDSFLWNSFIVFSCYLLNYKLKKIKPLPMIVETKYSFAHLQVRRSC